MRVLIIVTEMYSYGGTGRFLKRLLQLHGRHGIDTAILVPAHLRTDTLVDMASQYGVLLVSEVNKNSQNTRPLLTPCFDLLFARRTIFSWRPDLLVVSTADPGRMSVALYLPTPVLYILHTVPEKRFRFLPRLYLRIGSLLNNLIMTVSKSAAGSISRAMGIPIGKIEVVYNSCCSVESHQHSKVPIVLTAGHLEPYKNPDVWLMVAQKVLQVRADVTFVWLGDGTLLEPFQKQVVELGLAERILLPGYISDPSVWYRKAQVYFQPSLRESHGIAVLEAMVHGLPCVVTNTGGLPESVVNGDTGYVCPPADSAALAGRITDLLGDTALRERMGTAGRQRVEKCFSEGIQEQKIMALYQRLVNKQGKQ